MSDLCPLLPVMSRWQSPCWGIQAAEMSALGWGAGAGVMGSQGHEEPHENQSPMASCFSRAEVSLFPLLVFGHLWWWLCLVSLGKSSVPRPTASFQELTSLTAPFPTPAGSCGWIPVSLEKECFIPLLQASQVFSPSLERERFLWTTAQQAEVVGTLQGGEGRGCPEQLGGQSPCTHQPLLARELFWEKWESVDTLSAFLRFAFQTSLRNQNDRESSLLGEVGSWQSA